MRETSIFEVLRRRIDLAELAGRHTRLEPSGRAVVGRCPHPDHEDSTPSFYIYDDRFFCYGCWWRGDVTDFHAGVTGLRPGMQAALDLAREFGVEPPKTSAEVRDKIERHRQLESKYLRRAQEHHEALSRHPGVVEWWEGRGFDEGLRDRFLLGATDGGAVATIPFWHRGRVHGLVRRKLRGEPKYVLPAKEDLVLGYRPLFVPGRAREGTLFVVEGYVDALALAALGYGVAAVGGTHTNQEQLAELKRLPGPLYVLPDADEEGERAARRLVEELYPKAMLCPPEYERKEK